MRGREHRLVVVAFVMVMALALAACSQAQAGTQPQGTPGDRSALQDLMPTPTATDVPQPTATAEPTATAQPTATPIPLHKALPTTPNAPAAPIATGKVILVSLQRQWLYAYTNGELDFMNAVETGRPELATPTGTFSVFAKDRNITFNSPWPVGSPFYYYPTHINYALAFKDGGFFLHDAWWHVVFGQGGNVPHLLANGTWETGSHGCVGMTTADAGRLYNWADVGTPVVIRQ